MVRASYDQKPYRRILMETYGAQVVPSPSPDTQYGQKVLGENPTTPARWAWPSARRSRTPSPTRDTKYSLGSVFDFVLLHQTVIGQEAIEQMAMAGEEPDVIIGCVGGGSNFAGLAFPFIGRQLRGEASYRVIAVEPEAAPSLTRGEYRYDFGDTGEMAPLVKMHTLGHDFLPPPIHAGGLRYHGMAPLVSKLVDDGIVEARAVSQVATFEAGVQFARTEGILPAPESSHAIRAAIDEALEAREAGESRVILFNLSGHGHFDLSAYEAYLLRDGWRTTSTSRPRSRPRNPSWPRSPPRERSRPTSEYAGIRARSGLRPWIPASRAPQDRRPKSRLDFGVFDRPMISDRAEACPIHRGAPASRENAGRLPERPAAARGRRRADSIKLAAPRRTEARRSVTAVVHALTPLDQVIELASRDDPRRAPSLAPGGKASDLDGTPYRAGPRHCARIGSWRPRLARRAAFRSSRTSPR